MKKRFLLIPLLLIGGIVVAENSFPEFPMTLYGDIKVGKTNVTSGTLKIYDSSNIELASSDITVAGKYGSNLATEAHLLLNKFEGSLTFKLTNNGRNYFIDSIDDSNKGEGCPSKDSITFASTNCRYDLTFVEETFEVNFSGSNVPPQKVTYGTVISKPADPTKNGYTFDDWYIDTGFTTFYNFTGTQITGNTNIYARWNENMEISTGNDAPTLSGSNKTIGAIVLDENIPTSNESITDSKDNKIEGSEVAAGNKIATIEGGVEIYPVDSNGDKIDATVVFVSPIAVKIYIPNGLNGSNGKNYMVKVKHTLETKYGYEGLTLNSGAVCNSGLLLPEDQYKGEVIIPVLDTSNNKYFVTIYTCSASSFVAYAETEKQSSSTGGGGSSGGGGGGGGGSSSTTKTTTTGTVNTGASVSSGNNISSNTEANNSQNSDNKNSDNSRYEDGNQSEILSNGFTRELNNAYRFAYNYGITTMGTIEKAQMNGKLTRIAMAKMLSNYAMNVLGMKPDKTRIPNFKDITAKLDADYDNGVTLSYQLGIMGIGIEEFRPYDTVKRGEFGTALSRMLFGLADGTDKYYTPHLKKLKEVGIITNDNPNLKELRGYVMLMLMRSAMK